MILGQVWLIKILDEWGKRWSLVINKKNIRNIIKDKKLGVTEKYILYFFDVILTVHRR